jgi:transcriptional regulator with XRE-family HTH domain
MSYATDHIATTLRNAREAKGLSQRALAKLAGVPQGHISRIENGAVDLRVSSLVALGRALDLELTLVPRKNVPAVNSIVRSTAGAPRQPDPATRKAWKDVQAKLDELLHAYPASTELAQLKRLTRDLQHLGFTVVDRETLSDVNKRVDAVLEKRDLDGVHHLLIEFRDLRNTAAHSAGSLPMTATVRPAYSLEEDDHGE